MYKTFISVVTEQNIKLLSEISMGDNMIVKAMNAMKTKNRERKTYAGICKHNTLKGRWMYLASLVTNKNEHGSGKIQYVLLNGVLSFYLNLVVNCFWSALCSLLLVQQDRKQHGIHQSTETISNGQFHWEISKNI